jgi:hypothetical protein
MTDEKILESKRRRIEELDTENGEVYEELQKNLPGFVMQSGEVRFNMLIDAFKEADLLPEEFWLDFEIAFQEKIKEALAGPLAQLQEARRRARLTVVKKAPGKLVDGQGRPLTDG